MAKMKMGKLIYKKYQKYETGRRFVESRGKTERALDYVLANLFSFLKVLKAETFSEVNNAVRIVPDPCKIEGAGDLFGLESL